MDFWEIYILTLLLVVVLCTPITIIQCVKVAKAEAKLKCRIKINNQWRGYYTLYVEEQNELFLNIVKMYPHKVNQYRKRPIKLHIGSATVGGVTTGGVYTTGGDTTKSCYRSEKMELKYTHWTGAGCETVLISQIVLSRALTEKAEKSKISSYLNGDTIQVIEKVEHSGYVYAALQLGYTTEAVNQSNAEDAKGYPSGEKCENIIRWLCGE